jgi:hypothetical protein
MTSVLSAIAPSAFIIQHNDDVDSAEEKKVSPKQQKRLDEQKARGAERLEKRKEQAMKKERKGNMKDIRDNERTRQAEEIRLEKESNKTQSSKKLEEAKRIAEEMELFEKEFEAEQAAIVNHKKKSGLESNRLGGTHMA